MDTAFHSLVGPSPVRNRYVALALLIVVALFLVGLALGTALLLPKAPVQAALGEPTPMASLAVTDTAQSDVPWVLVSMYKETYDPRYSTSIQEIVPDLNTQTFSYALDLTDEPCLLPNTPCKFAAEMNLHASFPLIVPASGTADLVVSADTRWTTSGLGHWLTPFIKLDVTGFQGPFWGPSCSPDSFLVVTKTVAINSTSSLASGTVRCPLSLTNARDPGCVNASGSSYYYSNLEEIGGWWHYFSVWGKGCYAPARYKLTLQTDRQELYPSPTAPSQAQITAIVTDWAGNPVAGDTIRFRLDPSDMGRLLTTSGVTDAQGQVKVTYQAPTGAELRGRTGVTVYARNETHAATLPPEAELPLSIIANQVTIQLVPDELPIAETPPSSLVTIIVSGRFGEAVANDQLELTLDPSDLGSLLKTSGVTDASGRFQTIYTAPRPADLHGRDRVLLRVKELTTGTEAMATIRFLGMRVTATTPLPGQRDVELRFEAPYDTIEITFDKTLNPATVNNETVSLDTWKHGDLGARFQAQGNKLVIKVTQNPIPDVGLQVKVEVKAGENGVKAQDGSLLLAPYTLRFQTVPTLMPYIVVSQVVDEPRVPGGGRTLALKPFAVRVEAGLSEDTELDDEWVDVSLRLQSPGGEVLKSATHLYYPGRWPPQVPDAAARQGNAAVFYFSGPSFTSGAYEFRATLHPSYAPEDVIFTYTRDYTMNVWRERRPGVLILPVYNRLHRE